MERWMRFWLFWLLLGLVVLGTTPARADGSAAVGELPQEQFELGGTVTAVSPQLQRETAVAPASRPLLAAGLALSQPEIAPGGSVTLTISIANEGTTVAGRHHVYLDFDQDMDPSRPGPFVAGSWADYELAAAALPPGEMRQWQMVVQLSAAAATPQRIGLYVADDNYTLAGQATVTLSVTGASAPPAGGQRSAGGTDEGWRPTLNAPATALFSGAATFGQRFETPPVRGQLGLNLGLAYNSRGTDGKLGWIHSGEVGEGWSLTGIPSITRKQVDYCWPGNTQWLCVVNDFSLTLNGASYDLQAVSETAVYGLYQAVGDPGLYVERRNPAGGNGSPANVTGEYWLVRTSDGATYRFGYTEDAEQILFRTNADGTAGAPYTGQEPYISTYRWWLDQAMDVHGNGLVIGYFDDGDLTAVGGDGCKSTPGGELCREVAAYPALISYNNTEPGVMAGWQSQVAFTYQGSGRLPVDGGAPIFATMRRVQRLSMSQAGQPVWHYRLDYTENWQGGVTVATLDSIQQQDFNGQAVLPAVAFAYDEFITGSRFECWDPPFGCGDVVYKYPYLKTMWNGYGGVYEFSYDSLSHDGVTSFFATGFKQWDGFAQSYPGPATTHIVYIYDPADGCFDEWDPGAAVPQCDSGPGPDSNKLVGFSKVVSQVMAGGSAVALSHTETQFHVGNLLWNGKQSWQGSYYAPDGQTLLSENSTTWSDSDSGANGLPGCSEDGLVFDYICQVQEKEHIYYYPSGGGVNRLVTWTDSYRDPVVQSGRQWGQITGRYTYFEDENGVSVAQWHERRKYLAETAAWIVVPWVQNSYDGNWNLVSSTFYLYDGSSDPDNQTLSAGRLTLQRRRGLTDLDPTAGFHFQSVDTVYGYDTYGNMIATTTYPDYGWVESDGVDWTAVSQPGGGSAGRTTATGYTDSGQVMGWTENPAGERTTLAYDSRFRWLPVSVTDANNLVTTSAYDDLGRLVQVVGPGATAAQPSLVYNYTLPDAATPLRVDAIVQPNGGSAVRRQTTRYYNGLGQLVQSSAVNQNIDGYGVGDAVTLTGYDALGRSACAGAPFAAPGGGAYQAGMACPDTPHTQTVYDDRGRLRQTVHPDGTVDTRTYLLPGVAAAEIGRGRQQEWLQNANGDITLYTYDPFGQLEWVAQKNDGVGCDPWEVTEYDWDGLGHIVTVTRGGALCPGGSYAPGTAVTTMSYDDFGHKTTMQDPDMGRWQYGYNAVGSLLSQTDANGSTLCFFYDDLDRLTAKSLAGSGICPATPPVSGVEHLATYLYGAVVPEIGRLTAVYWGPDPTGNYDSFIYDSLGRAAAQTRRIDGQAYTMTTLAFDALNRPLTVEYPDGEQVVLTYDQEGEDRLTAGGDLLVSGVAYNERGQIARLFRGNGYHTQYTYYGAAGSGGNGRFRLQGIQHGSPGDALPDVDYSYDLAGNVTALTTQVQGSPADSQSFSYDHLGRLITAQATGGSADYSQSFSYDLLGNILSTGSAAYTYGDPDHRQAVTAVSGAQTSAYGYDSNGNMVWRSENGSYFNQIFDVENRLVLVERNAVSMAAFAYDADGQRVKAVLSGGELVHYPFPNYEVIGPGESDETTRSVYILAGQTVAQRERQQLLGEDFEDGAAAGWAVYSGSWQVTGQIGASSNVYAYRQSSTTAKAAVTNLALTQSGATTYRWTMTFDGGQRKGFFYFLRSEAGAAGAGNSYFVYQDESSIYLRKRSGGSTVTLASAAASTVTGQDYQYEVRFGGENGRLRLFRDGQLLLDVTDAAPLSSGNYIALRTKYSAVSFDDIQVHSDILTYFYADHLGSTSIMSDAAGNVIPGTMSRYLPFGSYRQAPTAGVTDRGFTGQRHSDDIGLIYMNARYYVPGIGRFASADTIVPDPANPQSYNRYSYAFNNPLGYNDPSGHCPNPANNGYTGTATEIICVAWFIPTARSGVPLSPDFIGDDRDFSSDSAMDGSRAWAWIDAKTGKIIGQGIHKTCNTWGQCAGPLDNEGLYQSSIETELQEDGSIKLTYSILCAGLRCAVAPGPDGEIEFIRKEDGSFTSRGKIDAFPNVEAYYYSDLNEAPETLFRHSFVSEKELSEGVTAFRTSTFGMMGVDQFEWDYDYEEDSRVGGY